jgi:hypothetical protein
MKQRSWNKTGTSINMRHALWIVHQFLPHKLLQQNMALTKISTQRVDDGWLMVLGREKRGTSEVAFIRASHFNLVYGLAALAILHNTLTWKKSKF